MVKQIRDTINILKTGGIAIIPTDTAFALSCRIDNEKAVKRLFSIKQRSEQQAVPILIDSIAMAGQYGEISDEVKNVLKKYWPGALTIIVSANESKIPSLVRGMGQTVGLRQPNHEMSLEIIKAVGVPLIGTSANFHGHKTPYAIEDIDAQLIKKVDTVLSGNCLVPMVSTILDTTKTPWKIIRQGALHISI